MKRTLSSTQKLCHWLFGIVFVFVLDKNSSYYVLYMFYPYILCDDQERQAHLSEIQTEIFCQIESAPIFLSGDLFWADAVTIYRVPTGVFYCFPFFNLFFSNVTSNEERVSGTELEQACNLISLEIFLYKVPWNSGWTCIKQSSFHFLSKGDR